MSNLMLGFPNRCDEATLSGGSWSATLPLANLQNRTLAKKARSTGLTLANTQFDLALPSTRQIRALAFVNHNLSFAAQYRIRGSLQAGVFDSPIVDSGWQNVWPLVYTDSQLEWEDDNWWSGQYTLEQVTGITWQRIHIFSSTALARYWRIEFDDTANTAGYIELGRLFIGPVWQPSANASYGASIGWETRTQIDESISGAEYFDRRNPYRVARFQLDHVPLDEALGNGFEITRRAGLDAEVLYLHDPADTVHALRRQFLGRMRSLSALEQPYYNAGAQPYEIKELL